MTPKLFDQSFLEARAHLLELAAFMDRCDREAAGLVNDYRLVALGAAVNVLSQGQAGRAARILEALSDPTPEPIQRASTASASGAWREAVAR